MSISLATPRPRRRPSLTPMVDVVFLLLVFFMLAARFGAEGAVELSIGGEGGAEWQGPPRLVEVASSEVRLNGRDMAETALAAALDDLTESRADPILLRAAAGADLQRLTDVVGALSDAGFTALVLLP